MKLCKLIRYSCIVSFCFIIMACNSNSASSGSQQLSVKDTLKFTGCPEKIKATIGSIIEIRLEAVPATGYEWILKDSPVQLKEYKTDTLNYKKQGETSFQILHFEAVKKGKETIHLEYKRTFEKKVGKSCDVEIEII